MFRKILLLASMVATLTLAVIAVGSLPASRLVSLKIAGLPQTAWPISIPMFSSPPSGVEPLDRIEIITQIPPEDVHYDAPPFTGAVTAIKPIAAFPDSLSLGYDYDLPDDVRLKSGQDIAHEANLIPDGVAIDNLPLTTYTLVDSNPRESQDISPASGRIPLTDQEAELAITFSTSPVTGAAATKAREAKYDAPPFTGAVTAIKPIGAFHESLGLGYDYDLPDDVRLKSGQDIAHEANIIPDSVAIDNLPLTTYTLVDSDPRLSQDISPASGPFPLTDQEAELAITFSTSPVTGTAAKKARVAKSRPIKTAMVKKPEPAVVIAAQPSLFPWGTSPGMNPLEPFLKKVPNRPPQ